MSTVKSIMPLLIIHLLLLLSCSSRVSSGVEKSESFQITKTVEYNGVSVDLVIDKPEGDDLDLLIVYRGTVRNDSLILQAA